MAHAPGRSGFVAANIVTPVRLPGQLVVSDLMADDPDDLRPDATVPGTPNVGLAGPWSLDAGSIGVSGGSFYSVSGLFGLISIGTDRPPNRIEATLYSPDYTNLAPIVAVRYIDASNFLFAQPEAGRVRLKSRIADVDSNQTGGSLIAVADGVPLNVVWDFTTGVFLVQWVNRVFSLAINLGTSDNTLFRNRTRIAVGFRNDTGGPTPSSAARISNLRVWA